MSGENNEAARREIARTYEQVKAAGIPDELNRWIGMTPERLAEIRAAIAHKREEPTMMVLKTNPTYQTPGPKEQQQRLLASAKAARVDVSVPTPQIPKTKPAAPAPEPTQEKPVKTTAATKTKPAPAKKAPAKPAEKAQARPAKKAAPKARTAQTNARTPVSARPDGLREGSKQAIMLDMALRPEGATEAAICKVLDWKKCRVTLKRTADRVGAKLSSKKNVAGENVYFATMPKAKK